MDLDPKNLHLLENWEAKKKRHYQDEYYVFKVRDKELKIKTHTESLSHTQIPKVAVPKFEAWGEILKWALRKTSRANFLMLRVSIRSSAKVKTLPVCLPVKADLSVPTSVSTMYRKGLPAKRFSTAFDSVTLYGQDPDHRPGYLW
jgi:methylmalonyl-CoA mutase